MSSCPPTLDARATQLAAAWPVRKTRAQKAAFRAALAQLLASAGWPVQQQSAGRRLPTTNVVAGNVETASLVLTAHYDTPARLPLPNFMAPRNLALTLLYQLFLCAVLFAVALAVLFAARFLGAPGPAAMALGCLALLLLAWLLLAGPANPHNANDNTSGTLALAEIACALPRALQQETALVFFDNEEKGLLGSASFARRHGPLDGKLLLNFDCVGVGDTMLFALPKPLRRNAAARSALLAAFAPAAGKTPLIDASPFTIYPSDQVFFKNGVAVAALRTSPLLGLYVSRIHTARDTLLDTRNIVFLRRGVCRFLAAQSKAAGGG